MEIRKRKTRRIRSFSYQASKFWRSILAAMSYATTTETLRIQRITVDQLRTELKVNRIKVSEAANELKTYVEKIQREDPLVTGVPGNQNPFKERSSCTLIQNSYTYKAPRIKVQLSCKFNRQFGYITRCDLLFPLRVLFTAAFPVVFYGLKHCDCAIIGTDHSRSLHFGKANTL